jgi:DNA mismatch endonuclease, patch repair protein
MNQRRVKRNDPLSPQQRSARMAKVRAKNSRSTEMHVAACLVRFGLRGWKRHPELVPGHPDFCFIRERVAIFVDGCFWHGCPQCQRNIPRTRRSFWEKKLRSNRIRDRRVKRILQSQGYAVVRIWEHALCDKRWLSRLMSKLQEGRRKSS